jgi:hypothetical protein
VKKKARGKDNWVIQFYISDGLEICNMHRPIPNSNGVLACATGDGLLLALLELTWYAPPHLHLHLHPTPQHHTLIGPLLFNLWFGTQIMCIYIFHWSFLSCYKSVLALLQYSHCPKPTILAKFFQFCEALINKYSNTCLCFNISSFSFSGLGLRYQIIILFFKFQFGSKNKICQ